MADFTYTPSRCTLRREPRVLSARFGDGYEQRAADGINNTLRVYDLEFAGRSTVDAAAIDTFLTSKAGVTAFTWNDLDGNTLTVVCRSWSRSYQTGAYQNVSAVFEEVAEA